MEKKAETVQNTLNSQKNHSDFLFSLRSVYNHLKNILETFRVE